VVTLTKSAAAKEAKTIAPRQLHPGRTRIRETMAFYEAGASAFFPYETDTGCTLLPMMISSYLIQNAGL